VRTTRRELTKGSPIEPAQLHRLYPRNEDAAAGDELGNNTPAREVEFLREMLAERGNRVADKDRTIDGLWRQLAAVDEERRANLGRTPAREAELLREMLAERDNRVADKDRMIDELQRQLAAVDEERRTNFGRTPAREVELLREMLAERDKRVADKDTVIDELRRQLAAIDEERRTISVKLTALLTDRRVLAVGGGLLSRALKRLGTLVVFFADMILLPPLAEQEPRAEHVAEEKAALREAAAKEACVQALLEQIARLQRQQDVNNRREASPA
jgi:hypothetical protein